MLYNTGRHFIVFLVRIPKEHDLYLNRKISSANNISLIFLSTSRQILDKCDLKKTKNPSSIRIGCARTCVWALIFKKMESCDASKQC
jgi:hypothetical protein